MTSTNKCDSFLFISNIALCLPYKDFGCTSWLVGVLKEMQQGHDTVHKHLQNVDVVISIYTIACSYSWWFAIIDCISHNNVRSKRNHLCSIEYNHEISKWNVCIPSRQVRPSYPAGHSHLNLFRWSVQLPPLTHGLLAHSSISACVKLYLLDICQDSYMPETNGHICMQVICIFIRKVCNGELENLHN